MGHPLEREFACLGVILCVIAQYFAMFRISYEIICQILQSYAL